MKKLVDRIQVWFFLMGWLRLASFIDRFGTRAFLVQAHVDPNDVLDDDDTHERGTSPDGVTPSRKHLEGPGWRLDEFLHKPLKVITFDPTFNDKDNKLIDMGRDIALPHSKLDVN